MSFCFFVTKEIFLVPRYRVLSPSGWIIPGTGVLIIVPYPNTMSCCFSVTKRDLVGPKMSPSGWIIQSQKPKVCFAEHQLDKSSRLCSPSNETGKLVQFDRNRIKLGGVQGLEHFTTLPNPTEHEFVMHRFTHSIDHTKRRCCRSVILLQLMCFKIFLYFLV